MTNGREAPFPFSLVIGPRSFVLPRGGCHVGFEQDPEASACGNAGRRGFGPTRRRDRGGAGAGVGRRKPRLWPCPRGWHAHATPRPGRSAHAGWRRLTASQDQNTGRVANGHFQTAAARGGEWQRAEWLGA